MHACEDVLVVMVLQQQQALGVVLMRLMTSESQNDGRLIDQNFQKLAEFNMGEDDSKMSAVSSSLIQLY